MTNRTISTSTHLFQSHSTEIVIHEDILKPVQQKSERQIEHDKQLSIKRENKIRFEKYLETLPALSYPSRYNVECINSIEQTNVRLPKFLKAEPEGVFGVDFEWPPTFIKGQREKKISLIQICAAKTILLFQVGRMKKLPQELQNFFENKELLKTGVNIKMDGQKLYRDFGIKTNGLVELMTLANLSKSSDVTRTHHRSLRALTAIFLKQKMAKGKVRMSNWSAPVLSPNQKKYAALDAYASYQIYQTIKKEGIENVPIEHLLHQNLSTPKVEKKPKTQIKTAETKPTSNYTWRPSSTTVIERQELLKQKGYTIWFTGLSASGKSTLATALEQTLLHSGISAYRLDGDNIRFGLNKNLGFGPEDRTENIRRISEVAKLFADATVVAMTAFISPYRADRDSARALHEAAGIPFIEVFVDAPLEVVESRDPKGLYKKAKAGEIKEFTGISAPYEAPLKPEIHIHTDQVTIEQGVELIIDYLLKNQLLDSEKIVKKY
ncbi:hypothetical protein G6F57_006279 [Rhizopus arrhizus]|nr:hypothetical protein G6F57_006279 [Rhizopus arrhizus]